MESWRVGDYCEACVKVIRENPGALCQFAMRLPDGKMCLGFCVADFKPESFPGIQLRMPQRWFVRDRFGSSET